MISEQAQADVPEPAIKSTRRRSLGALLRTAPPFLRTSARTHVVTSKAIAPVPLDIIYEIAELLCLSDVLSFSLTCSGLRTMLIPVLYETVTLRSSRKCQSALAMLLQRPDICVHVRKFAVRPNYYLAWPTPDETVDEEWVARKIEEISPHLSGLHTFDWDGLEMPLDSMWGALRKSCPDLRNIFCNVGSGDIDPESQLFKFANLQSFSFIVRYGLGGTDLFPNLEPLPDQFWDMLLHRCPNLEELAICSFSSSTRILDFTRVTEGRWHKLASLTLGSFGYRNDFSLGPLSDISLPLFLNAHRSLKYLRFQWNFKRWMSPESMPLPLAPDALPALDTFIGVHQQLAELPNLSALETLDLTCEPLQESRVAQVCDVFKKMPRLASLDLWMHVAEPDADYDALFASLFGACPGLTDFHFMCTTAFTRRALGRLLAHVDLVPSLRRFSLTKGHKYTDESMLSTALRILRAKSGLKQINIRWARERAPNHLKQEGSYDVVVFASPPGVRRQKDQGHAATATTTPSTLTTMTCLVAVERGIPLVGRPFCRKFKYKVRPDPHEAASGSASAAAPDGSATTAKMEGVGAAAAAGSGSCAVGSLDPLVRRRRTFKQIVSRMAASPS